MFGSGYRACLQISNMQLMEQLRANRQVSYYDVRCLKSMERAKQDYYQCVLNKDPRLCVEKVVAACSTYA